MTADRAGAGEEQVSLAVLVSGSMPAGFARSVETIRPGGSVSCSGQIWRAALLVVGRGALDVEASDGSRTRFPAGAVLAVAELPAGRLHNGGAEPVSLIVVRRASSVESPPPRLQHHGSPRAGATDDFRARPASHAPTRADARPPPDPPGSPVGGSTTSEPRATAT